VQLPRHYLFDKLLVKNFKGWDMFFRKEKLITETVCKECGMEFSEPERMLRHMIKAHSKRGKFPNGVAFKSCICSGRVGISTF